MRTLNANSAHEPGTWNPELGNGNNLPAMKLQRVLCLIIAFGIGAATFVTAQGRQGAPGRGGAPGRAGGPAGRHAGTVERITVHGKSLERNLEADAPDRQVTVYLPPSYAADQGRRFP